MIRLTEMLTLLNTWLTENAGYYNSILALNTTALNYIFISNKYQTM